MLIDIVSVSALPDFVLDLHYENGERRRFDFKPLMAMKPWNRVATESMFSRVKTAHGTITWPGEIDIAPETLYQDSVPLHKAVAKEI
jgi:hypothetical protein